MQKCRRPCNSDNMIQFLKIIKQWYEGLIAHNDWSTNVEQILVDSGYKELGYKGLSPMRDDFSGPFDENVRNLRQW